MAKTLFAALSASVLLAACASQPAHSPSVRGGRPQQAPPKVEWKLVDSGVQVKTEEPCQVGSSFIGPDNRKYVCTGTQKVAKCKSKKTGMVVHDGPCRGDE